MRKQRFTFTELVLVAFCAAVTGALVIAAASGDEAKVAACANNMRVLEKKLTAWENDHYGAVIYSIDKNNRIWGRQLMDGGYFDDTGYHSKQIKIYPKGFECPAETRQRNNGKENIAHPSVNILLSYDYALNWYTHQRQKSDETPAFLRSQVEKPARLMRMTEATKHAVNYKPEFATKRHGENCNVMFFDGHVEFMPVLYKGVRGYSHFFWFNK